VLTGMRALDLQGRITYVKPQPWEPA